MIHINKIFPPGKYLLQGNEACVIGALLAECRFFAAYPITPANEISIVMAKYLPLVGGTFIQAEDEICAIMSVIGASWAGVRAMTATSGPGFSLMQEGLGYAVMVETPLVIVDVMRLGPGTGQATKSGQGDVMQAIWGRHGDQAVIVMAPASAQEMLDFTIDAFNLADEYRVPVIICTDQIVGHTYETVNVPHADEIKKVKRREPRENEPHFGGDGTKVAGFPTVGKGYRVSVTGSTHDEWGYRKTQDPEVHARLVWHLVKKIMENADKIFTYEIIGKDTPKIAIIAYGSVFRSAMEAVKRLRDEGINVGLFRPKILWPIYEKALEEFLSNAEWVVVPEMNIGMYVREIERLIDRRKIVRINKIGGGVPIYPEEIIKKVKGLM